MDEEGKDIKRFLESIDKVITDGRMYEELLLKNIKDNLSDLEELLEKVIDHWGEEDYVYRFYHQSFKVYGIQGLTEEMHDALQKLSPRAENRVNKCYETIVIEGTGKEFKPEHNQRWLEETRPMVEAYFHSKYFLEMAIKYGKELDEPPSTLPSGWAAVLYLYNMR